MSENPDPHVPQQGPAQPGQPQPGPYQAGPYQPGQPYQGQPQPGQQQGQPYQGQPYQGQPQQGPVHGAQFGASGPYQPQPLTPSDERMWTVFAQVGLILLSFIAPLVIWLVFRERSRFVEQEAKEALNFSITLVIAHIAAAIITSITFGIGGIVYLAFIAALVFSILAAVENGKGAPYRYPVNIRFIK